MIVLKLACVLLEGKESFWPAVPFLPLLAHNTKPSYNYLIHLLWKTKLKPPLIFWQKPLKSG